MAKLSREDILKIYKEEGLYRDIARRYCVSTPLICHIKTGHSHSDITGAKDSSSERRRVANITKQDALDILEYLNSGENSIASAVDKFNFPIHTIRRVVRLGRRHFLKSR